MKILIYIKLLRQKQIAKLKKTKFHSIHISRDFQHGNYCIFGTKCHIDKHVKIGNFNYFNANQLEVIIESNTVMGSFCSIAPGVIIGLGNHDVHNVTTHPILFDSYYSDLLGLDFVGKQEGLKDKDLITSLGSDVWIGARATIKRGISIGDGAVIAGGAVVTKDVPAYAIVGGIPAKVLEYRFDEGTIAFLNEHSNYTFWKWDEKYLRTNLTCLNNIHDYMNQIKKYKSYLDGQ